MRVNPLSSNTAHLGLQVADEALPLAALLCLAAASICAPGAADIVEVAHVEQQAVAGAAQGVADRLLGHRCRGAVQATDGPHDDAAAKGFFLDAHLLEPSESCLGR
jgi:hypothetical protein